MDVDILIFVKIGFDAQQLRVTADTGDRRLGGFLHDVAQRACQHQLARAFHDRDLDRQQLAADRRPRKAVDHADLVLVRQPVGQEFLVAEHFLHDLFVDLEGLGFAVELLHGAFAQERGDLPFELAHARLAGIVID